MSRAIIAYIVCLPLAVLIGFMLATPTDMNSFAFILMAFSVLTLPVILRHHHFFLALTWNAALIVFFLPGEPPLGLLMAGLSLGIAIIERTMRRNRKFLSVPCVTWPLIVLGIVVVATAQITGGIGGRVLGSETWGAKRYLGVFTALLGYFALTAEAVPKEKAMLYIALFFLGGTTSVVSDLVYMAGPQFYFIFLLIRSDYAGLQAVTADTLMRLSGLAFACSWGVYYLLGRHGIEGIFDLRAPWRLVMMVFCVGGSLLGGYRGLLILLALVIVAQFLVERVHRKRLGPVLIFATLLMTGITVAFVDRMPLAVQRAFSFLPLDRLDPSARMDALGTLDWRLSMWKILVPEIPKYLIVGKGYGFSGTDYYLTQEAMRHGMYSSYEDTLVSGNYHNGILTLLIPFGIFGFTAFIWFCGSSLWVLSRNLRYGDPGLRTINTFLMALFGARLLFYLIFYGQFDLDFAYFTGAVGLSVTLNGGVAVPVEEPDLAPALISTPRLAPIT